jgi:hypothetical protein
MKWSRVSWLPRVHSTHHASNIHVEFDDGSVRGLADCVTAYDSQSKPAPLRPLALHFDSLVLSGEWIAVPESEGDQTWTGCVAIELEDWKGMHVNIGINRDDEVGGWTFSVVGEVENDADGVEWFMKEISTGHWELLFLHGVELLRSRNVAVLLLIEWHGDGSVSRIGSVCLRARGLTLMRQAEQKFDSLQDMLSACTTKRAVRLI